MFRNKICVQDTMCCRMMISRACRLTGAYDLSSVRSGRNCR